MQTLKKLNLWSSLIGHLGFRIRNKDKNSNSSVSSGNKQKPGSRQPKRVPKQLPRNASTELFFKIAHQVLTDWPLSLSRMVFAGCPCCNMAQYSFPSPNNTASYGYAISCLSTFQLTDTWTVSTFWLL